MREELDNDLEEEDIENYDRRGMKSLEYKINVYIIDFYCGMHVEKFLDYISDIENFFQYTEIPQDK